jgi:DNA-binding CsgD family transcriptional regulator
MTDQSADEAEILELIHRNRIAIWTGDYDLWGTCFVQSDYLTRWGWWKVGGIFIRHGWDDISARARSSGPPPTDAYAYNTKVLNLRLQIRGDVAWGTYDQQYPSYSEAGHVGPGLVREMRVFERIDGQWKIALLAFLDSNAGQIDARMMQIDADGTAIWASPSAQAALADNDDIVVRNGKLRFRDGDLDKRFREALAWAATSDTEFMSNNGAVPIVAEAGENEPSRIYWVVTDSGQIVFSFGSNRVDAQRLDLAAAVYGLSPAQKQLCAHVAEGLSLNEIAEKMDITANTARTHLNRVFDKTGVRTQPALIRVLLTAVAPL